MIGYILAGCVGAILGGVVITLVANVFLLGSGRRRRSPHQEDAQIGRPDY